jgi:hypothetical protein
VPAPDVTAAIRDGWSIAIRAGSNPHRFIRIWAVVRVAGLAAKKGVASGFPVEITAVLH